MKIGHSLILWNIVVIIVVMAIGISGLIVNDKIARSFESNEKYFRSIITSALETATLVKRAEGHLMLFLVLNDDKDREKFYERYNSLLEEIKVLDRTIKKQEARDLLQNMKSEAANFIALSETIIKAYKSDMMIYGRFSPKRHNNIIRKFTDTSASIRQLGTDIAIFETVLNEDAHRAALKKAAQLQRYGFAIIMTAIVIALIQGYMMSKKIAVPLSRLKKNVSDMAGGNLDVAIECQTETDEIGELTSSFNIMAKALKESRQAIVSEKERLLVTLRSIGDGVIATDTKGDIALMNKSAESITGWSKTDAYGIHLSNIFKTINKKTKEASETPAEKTLRTGQSISTEDDSILIRRDGSQRMISSSAAPIIAENGNIIGAVLVFRDITEKQMIEEELLRAKHMESIGILAGGIAHDFNNILVGILGNISLARKKLDKEEKGKVAERLAGVEHAALRAKDLAYQLLTFSKGGAPVLKTTLINGLITESAKFALAGSNIICDFDFPEDLWPADIDRNQLSQVVQNLVINAKWAMPQGGRIEIKAENYYTDRQKAASALLASERYVKITVKDEGIGIPAENLPKIFDPYFTTKHKGSGLGLATVYSIIKRHGGHVAAESIVGQGTTFHIFLPASKNKVAPQEQQKVLPAYGKGRILVMDDEEIVRDVADNMLHTLGYEPVMTVNGSEAVKTYKDAMHSGQPFSAVILDLTIPGDMGGKETIREISKIDPNVRAIVASGYSADPVMADFMKHGFMDAINKPFTIEELSSSLQKVLG